MARHHYSLALTPAEVMFTGLVEIVATGGAHTSVADITLRANTRAPAQCPHEIALTATEGNLLRDAVNVVASTALFYGAAARLFGDVPNPIQSNQCNTVTMYLKDWFVSEVVTQRHQLWASTYCI